MLLRILAATGLAITWMFACGVLLIAAKSETVAGAALLIGLLLIFFWFRNLYWRESDRQIRELEQLIQEQRERLDNLTDRGGSPQYSVKAREIPTRTPDSPWKLLVMACVASIVGAFTLVAISGPVSDALAKGQIRIGLRKRGRLSEFLNVTTYWSDRDPLLFWLHVGSFVAMGLMFCLLACALWVNLGLRVAGYPVQPGTRTVARLDVWLMYAAAAVGVYWMLVFFGLRSLAGWLL